MLHQLHTAGVSYNAAEKGGGGGVPEKAATMSRLPAHPNKEKGNNLTPLGSERKYLSPSCPAREEREKFITAIMWTKSSWLTCQLIERTYQWWAGDEEWEGLYKMVFLQTSRGVRGRERGVECGSWVWVGQVIC